jgi:hypothetical protein
MKGIKKRITYTMFTTGASLVILALFAIAFDVEIPFNHAVIQIFAANIVINLGLFFLSKFEIRYLLLEYLIDVSYIVAVLIAFGLLFDWLSMVPVLLLVVMAVVIYIFAMIIEVSRISKNTKEINELLQKRKKKEAATAP